MGGIDRDQGIGPTNREMSATWGESEGEAGGCVCVECVKGLKNDLGIWSSRRSEAGDQDGAVTPGQEEMGGWSGVRESELVRLHGLWDG